ncbi:MAG: HesA/MoeB/ThiF family protein [Candidatus Binataceae bacterium]
MALTTQQIERYSRQIIVPRMGGRAQERLLAARMLIVGQPGDIGPVLSYMVGAGVGRIELIADKDAEWIRAAAQEMRALNPDAIVEAHGTSAALPNLLLALIGSGDAVTVAESLVARHPFAPAVIARLDYPARIGILPAPPPCARCARKELLEEFKERATGAGIVAMAAAVEAFKLLAGYAEDPYAVLIEFEGYATRSHELASGPACDCGRRGGSPGV